MIEVKLNTKNSKINVLQLETQMLVECLTGNFKHKIGYVFEQTGFPGPAGVFFFNQNDGFVNVLTMPYLKENDYKFRLIERKCLIKVSQ